MSRFNLQLFNLHPNARPSHHPHHRRGGGIAALAFAKIATRRSRIRRGPQFPTNRFLAVAKPKQKRNAFAVFSRRSASRPGPGRLQRSRPNGKQDRSCFQRCLLSPPFHHLFLLRQRPRRRRRPPLPIQRVFTPAPVPEASFEVRDLSAQTSGDSPPASRPSLRSNEASLLGFGRIRICGTRSFCAKSSDRPAVCRRSRRLFSGGPAANPRIDLLTIAQRFNAGFAHSQKQSPPGTGVPSTTQLKTLRLFSDANRRRRTIRESSPLRATTNECESTFPRAGRWPDP